MALKPKEAAPPAKAAAPAGPGMGDRLLYVTEIAGGIETPWFHSSSPVRGGILRVLPLRPIWPGFAVNILFYAAVLWMMFAVPFALRRRLRIWRGQCPACTYPVGQSPVCTECGAAVTPKSMEA